MEALVKQILTPPFIAMTDEPHQLSRGVQRKRPRPSRQLQTRLFWRAVALTVVAAVTAGHQILPRRASATRPGNHVVQRQLGTWEDAPAELAGIAIAQQNVLPRERPALLRNVPVRQKSDDRRNLVRMGR